MEIEIKPVKRNYKTTGAKALAALGFVAVLIFGAWGIIQVARLIPTLGSSGSSNTSSASRPSIFSKKENLSIVLDSANVKSGTPFTLSWKHENKKNDGAYTVTFSCRDGLTMEALGPNQTYQVVFCNTPFNLTNATNSVKLIAYSTKAKFLDVPVQVQFTNLATGEISAKADSSITVVNESFGVPVAGTTPPPATTTPIVPVPTKPVVTAPKPSKPVVVPQTPRTYTVTTYGRPSDPNGHPDLAAVILDAGSINPATNVYTPGPSLRIGNRAAVRFTVTNLGTKTVEGWYFNAVLPTYPMHIYTSNMEPMLGPGDKIEFTITFDMLDPNTTEGMFTLTVDPANTVWNESNENNNVAKVLFTVYR